jgi:tellurite resistance protein
MKKAIDWDAIRYRGDTEGVRELHDVYRVEHYLQTYEQGQRQLDQNIRDKFLANSIRLSEQISPRIFAIYRGVCENLGLDIGAEIFCTPSSEVNAAAILDTQEATDHCLIGVTSAALEKLEDAEIASILGHELGHFLFKNHRLNALINEAKDNPAVTVLPPLGESLFLRWRKKAEISADRVGLLACGDFASAARGLLKATFGLSDRNINLNIDGLLAQIDEAKGSRELMNASFESHPLLPIRLKALELFSRSENAATNGYVPVSRDRLSADALEDAVDNLMRLTARYPDTPISQTVMRTVALGGVLVLAADGDISEYETKIMIEILHRYFTDEPEKEIVVDTHQLREQLDIALKKVNELGGHDDKVFIVSRLADIALADGALMSEEGAIVLEIAERLGLPARTVHSVFVGAAETVGFRVDVKLNRVADELRRSLRVGCGLAPVERSTPR